MRVKIDDHELTFEGEVRLIDIANQLKKEAYCAKVNNRLRELNYIIKDDCVVEFLDLNSPDSMSVYQTTLRYIVAMAVSRLDINADLIINHSISRSFYCEVINSDVLVDNYLELINKEVNNIISAKLDINRVTVSKDKAKQIYNELKYNDKLDILKYRPEETVHLYECGNYFNYMFAYMLPNTSYIKEFKMIPYYPGFILQYPRAELKGIIPPFEDAITFGSALKEANKWGRMIDGNHIASMNKKVELDLDVEFINLCESKHNMQLAKLGDSIVKEIENIKLIAIAGPSSSGKTTFTNRLKIELMIRNINPVMISIDDYYFGKEKAPKNEDGTPDLEHLHALDVELFNKDMLALISGKEVQLPHFDFESGTRLPGKKVKLENNSPIMIEGIHALNDELTMSIPNYQKYRIYISPQVQMHLDNHNPISMTDIRLLRRMVRDNKFRNSSAEETLSMWKSVRRGEFKWIYNNQENANFVYNSELTYELCVMKKYALPILEEIKDDSPYFIQANKLIKFLKYFKDIDEQWVPCNSLLREFIGGSSFYKK